jgi:acyl-CoA thioester hydrolase
MVHGKTSIRVRYGETDPMGVVYHANYLLYYETARTEMLRDLGMSYKEMEESGILLPVVHVEINYIAPAWYDDLLEIRTCLNEKPGIKLKFKYEIASNGKLINKGSTVLVFTNASNMKPCRPPANFLNILEPFF